MSLRKLADYERPCTHPGHEPPKHIVLDPGKYEYECPGCRRKILFSVERITFGVTSDGRWEGGSR